MGLVCIHLLTGQPNIDNYSRFTVSLYMEQEDMDFTWAHTRGKLYVLALLLQILAAANIFICKISFGRGLSPQVYVVYRYLVAAVVVAPFAIILERRTRPRMTFGVCWRILFLALLGPVLDENLKSTGIKFSSPTISAAIGNLIPAVGFLVACLFRREEFNIKKRSCQAKLIGITLSLGGVMMLTFLQGPVIELPYNVVKVFTAGLSKPDEQTTGTLLISASIISSCLFDIFLNITLEKYPAKLTLNVLINSIGALSASVVTAVAERHDVSAWSIKPDLYLLPILYGGIVMSSLGFYIIEVLSESAGPTIVLLFQPLGVVIVAIVGCFILYQFLYLLSVFGIAIIALGLYIYIWGINRGHEAGDEGEANEDDDVAPVEASEDDDMAP